MFTGLFRLTQIFVGMTPDEARYFANPGTGAFNPNFFFHWEDFNNEPVCAGDKPGTDEWKRFTSTLLSIPMAHQLIGFYTVADSSDGCLKVMRSYQYYAAAAISDKVRRCKWDERPKSSTPGRPGGYIWHTTGSGKTMTSFKSAQLIADSHDADKVVFLMDRIELGTQSLSEYRAFADDADDVQGTENTQVLKSKLASDDPKNRLIVTSIQKMSNVKAGEGRITQAELDRLAAKRIVFIIDECHRSTFGDMRHTPRVPQRAVLRLHRYADSRREPEEGLHHRHGIRRVPAPLQHRRRYPRRQRAGGFDPYMVTTFDDHDVREAVALEQAKASSVGEAIFDERKSKVFYYYMDQAKVPMGPMVDGAGNPIKGHRGLSDPRPVLARHATPRQGRRGRAEALPRALPRRQVPRNPGDQLHPRPSTTTAPSRGRRRR